MEKKYGCQHYDRKCQIQAPCCKIWYKCRLCHNEQYQGPKGPGCLVETMDRYAINNVKCLDCDKEQEPSQNCKYCQVQFALYYCDICHLWSDNVNKQIFHCDKCRMCRIGKKEENYHCDKCQICYNILHKDTHKCIDNVADKNCPICLEYLKTSTKRQIPLNCGHWIHEECYNNYLKSTKSNLCPICNAAQSNMDKEQIEYLDKIISETSKFLPEELKNKNVVIVCNECQKKSTNVQFHPYGMKCSHCGSYQTDELQK